MNALDVYLREVRQRLALARHVTTIEVRISDLTPEQRDIYKADYKAGSVAELGEAQERLEQLIEEEEA